MKWAVVWVPAEGGAYLIEIQSERMKAHEIAMQYVVANSGPGEKVCVYPTKEGYSWGGEPDATYSHEKTAALTEWLTERIIEKGIDDG